MQHRKGDDETEEIPVRHIDMALGPARQGCQKDPEITNPDQQGEQIGIPLWLRIFTALRHPEQIAGHAQEDEQVIAPKHQPRCHLPRQPGAGGTLHHIKGCRKQGVPAKSQDNGGRMNRAQPAEIGPRQIEIEIGIGQLPGNDVAHAKTDNPPDQDHDHRGPDDLVIVFKRNFGRGRQHLAKQIKRRECSRQGHDGSMEH